MNIVRRGEIIRARTNYELLNKLLNKNLNGWMKCYYPLSPTFELLMHEFNKVTPAGWRNYENSDEEIIEQYEGVPNKPFKSHEGLPENKYRAIFEKQKDKGIFVFKGVYTMSLSDSTPNKRVWHRIAEQSTLNDF